MNSETFNTVGQHTWTAPDDLTATVEMWGAGGGDGGGSGGGSGGSGGYIKYDLSVSSGEKIDVYVAGRGEDGGQYDTPGGGGSGYVSGGAGGEGVKAGSGSTATEAFSGGGGGGATAVLDGTDSITATAGGGGGGGGETVFVSGNPVQGGGGGGGARGGAGGVGKSGTGATYGEDAAGTGAGGDGGDRDDAGQSGGYVLNSGTLGTGTNGGGNTGDATVVISYVIAPTAPTNVSTTYDSDDQLTLNWNAPSEWGGEEGNYRVEMERDGSGYSDPAGGPSTPSSGATSATYGPASDSAYDRQVGIDSSFKFRIRAENSAGNSSYNESGAVYTTPVPPHNPSVSRPDANTVELSYTVKTNIPDLVIVQVREDTGSGYGSWRNFDAISDPSKGNTVTKTYTAGTTYNYSSFGTDSRLQFRIESYNNDGSNIRISNWVYTDYGNEGNVYFEDDFESGDLSAWDSNNLAGDTGVNSGTGPADLTISGADEGTYYFYGEGEGSDDGTWIQKNLGDLSGESDVHVRCAFATASLDGSTEDFGISWYDGSSWQSLEHYKWEYNKQGWFEVHAEVPSSYLSTDNRVRVGTTTNTGMYGGDHFAVDRVVVSDILHEYTKPSAPSNLSLDNSTVGEITASWTLNASVGNKADERDIETWFGVADGSLNGVNRNGSPTSYTFTGLTDGEEYELEINDSIIQYRRGGPSGEFDSDRTAPVTGVTQLPAPTNLSTTVNDG